VAEDAVGGFRSVGTGEGQSGGFVPHRALFGDRLAETVVLEILAQAKEPDGIRLEREYVPLRANETGCQQREEANICAQIVIDHTGPEILGECLLYPRFTFPKENAFAGTRIQGDPEAGGAVFDLQPEEGVIAADGAAGELEERAGAREYCGIG